MKNSYVNIMLLCFSLITLKARSQDRQRCATDEHLLFIIKQNPSLAYTMKKNEVSFENWIASHIGERSNGTIATIPVIVHVIYNTSNENISDAQVQSQIKVFNQDFERLNPDTIMTRPIFKSVVANCHIQFCLAKQDPNGFLTNGIVHIKTNVTAFGTLDSMKFTSCGGDDAWPDSEYLNIWVCNMANEYLGYAQYPGGPDATDGIVTDYTAFGDTDNVEEPYNKGRTSTHEVGHWLNLYHPFNNGCVGTTLSTCDTSGDYCCDTPPEAEPWYGCLSGAPTMNTCGGSNMPDMIENFMDYTEDSCMNIFTQDQSARMTATLNTIRKSILTSKGCITGIESGIEQNSFDMALSVFPNPTNSNFTVRVAQPKYTNVTIQVFNLFGQLISSSLINDNKQLETSFKISDSPAGDYIIKISSNSDFVVKKIVLIK